MKIFWWKFYTLLLFKNFDWLFYFFSTNQSVQTHRAQGSHPSSPKLLVIENILSLNSRKPLFMFDLNAQVGDVAWAPYSRYLHIPLQNYNYFTFTIELTLDSEASTTHFISKTIWTQLFAFIIVLYFRRFNTVDSKQMFKIKYADN